MHIRIARSFLNKSNKYAIKFPLRSLFFPKRNKPKYTYNLTIHFQSLSKHENFQGTC